MIKPVRSWFEVRFQFSVPVLRLTPLFVKVVVASNYAATSKSPMSFSGFSQTLSGRSQSLMPRDQRLTFLLKASPATPVGIATWMVMVHDISTVLGLVTHGPDLDQGVLAPPRESLPTGPRY